MAAASPLAGSAGAFAGFGSALAQAQRGVRANLAGITAAARSADAVKRAADQSARESKEFVRGAGVAGRSVTGFAKTAGTANPGLNRGRSGFKQCARELKKIKGSADLAARSASVSNKGAKAGTKLTGPFRKGLTSASKAIKAVNLAMKANPWGLLISLLAPFVMELVDTALQSKAAQKIMKQVFDLAAKSFKAIAKFVTPLMKGVGTTVAKVWNGVKTVVSGVVRAIGGPLTRAFNGVRSGVSSATNAVKSVISTVWGGFKRVLQPVLNWLTQGPAKGFRTAKSAMSRTLTGMAGIVKSALQTVLGVIKGPINAVIGFANRLIDGLNSLSVNILGKKFGVNISRIPMLAAGGVVAPRAGGVPVILAEAGETEVVLPLAKLGRLLARTAALATSGPAAPHLDHYEEPTGRGAHAIAEDLLFLARTGAHTRR
ncbi:hypothetical protein ACFU99_23410 [Streptomyces sp. NPDC057654]|uniref:hypothetical protein n=1 Tax=Streptomyces sp. NPDC057654 TaxID=3346196 RepID=UPI0036870B31